MSPTADYLEKNLISNCRKFNWNTIAGRLECTFFWTDYIIQSSMMNNDYI